MRFVRHLIVALAACAFATGALAADPKSGVHYLTLPQAQNTDGGKKVEVIEFFAYYCPHCDALEPVINEWVRKQGDNIVYKRVHVERDINVLPQQRLFYTLEAMGILEQFHAKVFAAMHKERLRLSRDEMVFDWVEQAGIDRARFIDIYRSFGIQSKVARAAAMMSAYKIDSWPMIAIDGRWLTSPYQASTGAPKALSEPEQQQEALRVMDHLVARARAEKK
jgi:thiol:disulfide interchange protein DsbA